MTAYKAARWAVRPLVECGRLLSGGTPSKATAAYWQGTIPWYSSKELKSFELSDSELHVSPEGATEGSNRVPPGTVLFVVRGMSLANEFRVSRTLVEATFNQDVKAVVPASDIDSRYLARCLRWLEPKVLAGTEESSHGTKRLPGQVFENLPVPVPPLAEQRRIADILDKADAIRRKRKEAIALTDELLRSALLGMFGDPVTNPKGWPVKALGELAEAASGVTKGKRYEGQEMVTLPYMRVANVQDGHLVLDEVKTITVSEEDGRRYQLRVGDVLLTEGGDPDKLGRGTVWRGEIPNCIHQNHIFRVRPGSDVRPDYLSAIIGSERGKRYFFRAAKQTTGIATINMTQLKAFPVLLPPIELQDAYSAFIGRAATTRAKFESRGELVDHLFGSLVARAFSGSLEAPC